MSVKVSAVEKGVLVREAFELSMSSGSVVSVSEVVRRRLFPVSVGAPVVEPRVVPVDPKVVAVTRELDERRKVEGLAKVQKGHVHKVKANGPVPVCECGAVRRGDGSWGES